MKPNNYKMNILDSLVFHWDLTREKSLVHFFHLSHNECKPKTQWNRSLCSLMMKTWRRQTFMLNHKTIWPNPLHELWVAWLDMGMSNSFFLSLRAKPWDWGSYKWEFVYYLHRFVCRSQIFHMFYWETGVEKSLLTCSTLHCVYGSNFIWVARLRV